MPVRKPLYALSIPLLGLTLIVYWFAFSARAEEQSDTKPLVDAPPEVETASKSLEPATLRKRFAESLSKTKLVGNFTVTGVEKTELTPETYELYGVQHVKDDLWLFQARIKYGEHDVTIPITLPVRWAGDTPVICVDNMGFPGLGTYTARVMIYADHYAGFWKGHGHGGHLFGMVVRSDQEE